MSQSIPTYRQIAKQLADNAQMILMSSCDEALDGDQTEELSMMFQEELNELNGNK
jgi:hypothetical protein